MSFSGRSKCGSQTARMAPFQRVDAGVPRHPAGFDVQLGHALVVALEEGDEVLRQVFLVDLGERADDAEVQRDVAAEGRRRQADLDVAGVHVGVEEAVAKDLREEDRDAVARQLLDVDAGVAQPAQLADRHAVHALHHDHAGGAVIPHHLRDHHQPQAVHVAAQLGGVGGLAHQVELVVQVDVELGHHFARLQALAVGEQALDPDRQRVQQRQVVVDHRHHAGPQHLDRDLAAGLQRREVHLRDRGAGHRLGLEAGEDLLDRPAERRLDQGASLRRRERRHPVLQLGEFVGDVLGQQVATGRQHLAELDEDRAQMLQRHAQPVAARRVEAAPERAQPHPHAHPALAEAPTAPARPGRSAGP